MLDYNILKSEYECIIQDLFKLSPGERIKQKAKMKADKSNCLRNYISENEVLNLISKHYNPSRKGENAFYYVEIPKEKRFRIFIDLKLQLRPEENGYEGYEKREPGSLINMNLAFEYMKDHQAQPLDLNLIINMHKLAAKHIMRDKEYRSHIRISIAGEIKKMKSGCMSGPIASISPLGLFKMFNRSENLFSTYSESGEKYLTAYIKFPEEGYENRINNLISEYEEKIKAAEPLKKINIIVKLIQDLDFLHPFHDGNSRVFETLLLNRELIRHNFTPTILFDPNLFTSSTKQEVLFDVLRGMEDFEYFQKTGELPSCESSEIVSKRAKIANPLI